MFGVELDVSEAYVTIKVQLVILCQCVCFVKRDAFEFAVSLFNNEGISRHRIYDNVSVDGHGYRDANEDD